MLAVTVSWIMMSGRLKGALRPLHFLGVYWRAAAGAAYALTFGIRVRRHRELLTNIARHFGYDYHQVQPILPLIRVPDLVKQGVRPDLREISGVDGNVSLLELLVLAAVARQIAARVVFEIGTFDGRTTVNLAANADTDCVVYTLDLPVSLPAPALDVHTEDHKYMQPAQAGSRITTSEFAPRIRRLFGDSAQFDFSPYAATVDLCFVDGSHAYDYVLNDSARALRMLRPGGVVFWHDYAVWPGVTLALDELYHTDPAFSSLRWIEGTSLVVMNAQSVAGATDS